MSDFISPESSINALDADEAASLISATTDVAVVVDSDGRIVDYASNGALKSCKADKSWVGKLWTETVTVESKIKIEELLKSAADRDAPRWRQINHPAGDGPDHPVQYCAIKVGDTGHVIGLGRDMGQVAEMQQRLVAAQRSLEEHYARSRETETRFQALFQGSLAAIFLVKASTAEILGANRAAENLAGASAKRLAGRSLIDVVGNAGAGKMGEILDAARRAGEARGRVKMGGADRDPVGMIVSLVPQNETDIFIVQVADSGSAPASTNALGAIAEEAPQAIVFTDPGGQVLQANASFVDLVQLASEEQVRGQPIDNWLGRSGVEFNVLATNVREQGKLEHFATTLRGQLGSTTEVDVSAVPVTVGDIDGVGFLIRSLKQEPSTSAAATPDSQPSADQLEPLIGRMSLKQIVRQTADEIEKLCIESALQMTGSNRAKAAELLGLSRQSFYVKLRRYEIGDEAGDE